MQADPLYFSRAEGLLVTLLFAFDFGLLGVPFCSAKAKPRPFAWHVWYSYMVALFL